MVELFLTTNTILFTTQHHHVQILLRKGFEPKLTFSMSKVQQYPAPDELKKKMLDSFYGYIKDRKAVRCHWQRQQLVNKMFTIQLKL